MEGRQAGQQQQHNQHIGSHPMQTVPPYAAPCCSPMLLDVWQLPAASTTVRCQT
jgi:hypothetical protein